MTGRTYRRRFLLLGGPNISHIQGHFLLSAYAFLLISLNVLLQ